MTSGKEDYLKAIYLISESHELVTNKELSKHAPCIASVC